MTSVLYLLYAQGSKIIAYVIVANLKNEKIVFKINFPWLTYIFIALKYIYISHIYKIHGTSFSQGVHNT